MAVLKSSFPTIARIALGLTFTVFGLNGFLHFLPMPMLPGAAGSFMAALAASGYMFPLIKGTEVVAGLLLLAGRYVPLALTLLAPIIVNILAFHLALARDGTGMALFLVAVELYLAWHHRAAFRGVLAARSGETPAQARAGLPAPAVGRV
jgi:uncharacterized membrane protein YphA (DoxX/SURF4 family)